MSNALVVVVSKEVLFYVIVLNAQISSAIVQSGRDGKPTMEVSFVYQEIEWEATRAKIAATDEVI